LISNKRPTTDLIIEINHNQKIHVVLRKEGINTFEIPIPQNLRYPDFLNIKFYFLNAASPAEIGLPGNDRRKLGIGLISATFLP
jgi:hypothetical protein